MLSIFRRLMKSENGATAIEYTLIASLIAVAAIAAMNDRRRPRSQGVLTNVANAMLIAPVIGQDMGGPATGRPFLLRARSPRGAQPPLHSLPRLHAAWLCRSAKPIGFEPPDAAPPALRLLPPRAQPARRAPSIEYALLVALLSVAAVTALNNLGPEIQNVLTTATNAMN